MTMTMTAATDPAGAPAKRCSSCGKVKPGVPGVFHRNANRPDGLSSRCAVCGRAENAKRRQTPEYREWYRAYRSRPEVMERKRADSRRRYEEATRAKNAERDKSARGRVVRCRMRARARLRTAATPHARARAIEVMDLCDAELERMDAR